MLRPLRVWLAAGLIAAALLTPGGAQADEAMTAQDLRRIGYAMMAEGDAKGAEALAEALLARDTSDTAALMLRAQARLKLGRAGAARADARQVYRLSGQRQARFGAAMFVASSLVEDGYATRGQLWLRRAAQAAPDAEGRAAVAKDYDFVRSRNPWLWNFTLRANPSSNVNDGSTEASYTNPGIPWLGPEIEITGAQKALSGVEIAAGFGVTYRLPPTATTMTALHFRAEQTKVLLSSEAKRIAPGAHGSDYDSASIEAGISRRWRPEIGRTTFAFGAYASHDWAGGYDLSNALRLEAQADRPLGDRMAGMVAVSAERQWRLDSAVRSADVVSLTFGVQKQLANQDRLQLTLGGRHTATDSPGLRNSAVTARLAWDKAEPLAGFSVGGALSFEARDYPDSPFDLRDGRQDRRVALDITIQHEDVQFYGFSPTLDIRAARNHSDVGLYSSRDLGVTLGIQSSF